MAASGAAPVLKRIDENADSDASGAQSAVYPQAGDSRVSSTAPEDDADGNCWIRAVADRGDVVTGHAPHHTRVQRLTRPVYMTRLRRHRLLFWEQSHKRVGQHIGNIGIMFGNWGRMPDDAEKRRRVELQLKSGPAQILCVAEAEASVETLLESVPRNTSAAVADASEMDELEKRPAFQYMTIRGRERSSILVAVRVNVAKSLECLYWERREKGNRTGN